jgi:hypothetical protein
MPPRLPHGRIYFGALIDPDTREITGTFSRAGIL